MFKFKDVKTQLIEEKKKNAELAMKLDRTNANVDYIAMMTDVELEEETENENEV